MMQYSAVTRVAGSGFCGVVKRLQIPHLATLLLVHEPTGGTAQDRTGEPLSVSSRTKSPNSTPSRPDGWAVAGGALTFGQGCASRSGSAYGTQ